MDALMRSMLLREIGDAERDVAEAVERRRRAYEQLAMAEADAGEDRLIVARERAEAIWGRIAASGKQAA